MDLDLTGAELQFREDLQRWLDAVERPTGLRDYGATPTASDIEPARRWQQLLHAGGWAGLSWPVEHGGRGASPSEMAIFAEVMAEAGVPRQLNIVGLELAAPMIMAFGTAAQKARHLQAILTGEEVWCQLFSEPNAGSDLASLTTRATERDGRWLVSGQKVWTSGAHYSNFGLLLARTDPTAPDHRGISCFLLPMDRAGIEARPLIQMDGEAKFNEVFLDNVEVGSDDLLGALGQGWQVAMSTLGRERLSLGAQAVALLDSIERLRARRPERFVDAVVRQVWVSLWIRIRLLRMTWLRAVSNPGPAGDAAIAVLKLIASELQRDVAAHSFQVFGAAAQAGDDVDAVRQRFLAAPGARLAGGTSEIQRNILGERVLGLPREPRSINAPIDPK